ncbi:MAG: hypothetical protein AAFR66_02615 [Bacteroidota bacterium]
MKRRRNIVPKHFLSAWFILLAVIPVAFPVKTFHFFWHEHDFHFHEEDHNRSDSPIHVNSAHEHCDLCDEEIQCSPLPSLAFFSNNIDPYLEFSFVKEIEITLSIHTPYLRGPPASC